MHYSDQSHRWLAPDPAYQQAWEQQVRAHLDEHRATMGGPIAGGHVSAGGAVPGTPR